MTVVYQGDFADSIAPQNIGDILSPFGTVLSLSVIVSAGPGFSERVMLGQFLISDTPNIVTEAFLFNTAILTRGDSIDLSFTDYFGAVSDDKFDVPGSPPDLSSVWNEIQRLTGLPITRTITDGTIPASVAYQQEKLQAVYDLATVLDATAYMTSAGTVSMRPNTWPAPVDTISGGDGTLIAVVRGMSNASVRNKLVVRSYAGNGQSVLSSGEITDGPLRTRNSDGTVSPYRSRPQFYSSQFIVTSDQADAFVQNNLSRVSVLRSVKVVVTETFNPLRQVGDVVTVVRKVDQTVTSKFVARVSNIVRTTDATQQTTVTVGQ
ncbi:hypothetical protein D4765_14420 [Subtercola vilae]|uniref:DUF5047 domain-containing protein n=1 Tax=Subtercola vilae TaxID=2056433 RepID=A0A4V4REE3_9MICO|nr:hypothetical protein D4765_14420 [Subtercola vilae]